MLPIRWMLAPVIIHLTELRSSGGPRGGSPAASACWTASLRCLAAGVLRRRLSLGTVPEIGGHRSPAEEADEDECDRDLHKDDQGDDDRPIRKHGFEARDSG